jgi:hypothetical protein
VVADARRRSPRFRPPNSRFDEEAFGRPETQPASFTWKWWCAQSDTNRSRRPSGLISALLQGIFADTGLFRESAPCFGSDDQRLTGKFPTFVNRGIFSAIRPSSRDNSRLLRKIRQAPKQPFLARGLLVQHPYHTDGRGFTRKIRQSLDPISANRPFPKPMARTFNYA